MAGIAQLATRRYRKIARKAGIDAPPDLQIVPKGHGWAYEEGTDTPNDPNATVSLSKGLASQLARTTKGQDPKLTGKKREALRRSSRFEVLHELGHYATGGGEGAANHFANTTSKRLNRGKRARRASAG
jgi:hypothetical protein